MEKWPFFRAATAGLGKYHTGGYGRIRVYRVLGSIGYISITTHLFFRNCLLLCIRNTLQHSGTT